MTRPAREWQKQAACADIGPDVFTPDDDPDNDLPAGPMYNAARPICAGCPVRAECLEFALDAEAGATPSHRAGIYGGLSPRQRYAVYRERLQAALDALATAA